MWLFFSVILSFPSPAPMTKGKERFKRGRDVIFLIVLSRLVAYLMRPFNQMMAQEGKVPLVPPNPSTLFRR
ncbi:hypothetical protein F5148DRAFT_1215768 [Russula earlei]|uniref:Uncharacterized protein n=1 Tax=Russula earlei TaxID=71964 RepID=A0ACC0U3B4_9AGAM|nr:hypothetical protein F5148DRAFT_1215768 [Russula earlei]